MIHVSDCAMVFLLLPYFESSPLPHGWSFKHRFSLPFGQGGSKGYFRTSDWVYLVIFIVSPVVVDGYTRRRLGEWQIWVWLESPGWWTSNPVGGYFFVRLFGFVDDTGHIPQTDVLYFRLSDWDIVGCWLTWHCYHIGPKGLVCVYHTLLFQFMNNISL